MTLRPYRSRPASQDGDDDDEDEFQDIFDDEGNEFEDMSESSDNYNFDDESDEESSYEEDDSIMHSTEYLRDYLKDDEESFGEDILDRIFVIEAKIESLQEASASTKPTTNEDFYFVEDKKKPASSDKSIEKRLKILERESKRKKKSKKNSKKKGGKAREYLIDLIRNLRKELDGDPNNYGSVLREIKNFSKELNIAENENQGSKHYSGRNPLARAAERLSSHSRGAGKTSMFQILTGKANLKKDNYNEYYGGTLGALPLQKRRSSASKSGRRLSFGSATAANQSSEGKFPQDCYSFIALNGPRKYQPQNFKRSLFFLFGLLPLIFQMTLLIVLALSQTNEFHSTIGETDNPDQDKSGLMAFFANFTPANSTPIIRIAQVVSLATYLIFPGASLQHIVRAVQLFPRRSWGEDNREGAGYQKLSCILRLIQGVTAMVVTLFLVLTSTTIVEIVLNFTAVNFISGLANDAFALAISGEFSPSLQDEAERIADTDLPHCMLKDRDSKWKCHKWVAGLVFLFLGGMIASVFAYQDSSRYWVTGILRVQFQDATGLNQYSGCFEMNTDPESMHFSRRTYHSLDTSFLNTSFAYCHEDRQWILFKGNASDPCDTALDENGSLLARSAKTDTFDIATVFEEPWVSASNTPLDLYFFDHQDDTEITDHCKSSLDDGICDPFFNELRYDFDGGDCCAATCTKADCGRGGLRSVFGSDISGDGFENCVDPNFLPITIRLNGVTSSRNPSITGWNDLNDADAETRPWKNDTFQYDVWLGAEPVTPYFSLDCNGRNVMSAYIDDSMVNKNETVMVEDGATCNLVIERPTAGFDVFMDDPIWIVDYTIFHDVAKGGATKSVEILTSHSYDVGGATFTRIPECYFRKLNDDFDTGSIYKEFTESSSKKAMDMLLEDAGCAKIPSPMPSPSSSFIVL